MRALIALFTLAFTATQATAEEGVSFDDEFLQGMETGFFMRNNEEGYLDYECPELILNTSDQKRVLDFFGPVKMTPVPLR